MVQVLLPARLLQEAAACAVLGAAPVSLYTSDAADDRDSV